MASLSSTSDATLPASTGPYAEPVDYKRYLSSVALAATPPPIRGLFALENIPDMISFLAGKPNASAFPFDKIAITIKDPSGQHSSEIDIAGQRLEDALQYGPTAGVPDLIKFLMALQSEVHGTGALPPASLTVGDGSQDLITKAFLALVDRGDSVLIESPVYAGVLPMLKMLDANLVPVPIDEHGISCSHLQQILEAWPTDKALPKFLYTVPTGCNPTGVTTTLERRREALKICRLHKILILEDDPYFYLNYDTTRPQSYFSIDSSHVLRFDSMSKILSSGIRVGWATGPPDLIRAINHFTATLNLQPNLIAQTIILTLLEQWKVAGFLKHTQHVSDFYRSQRDDCIEAVQKYLSGVATWTCPSAGSMFHALYGDFASDLPINLPVFLWLSFPHMQDVEPTIRVKALEKGVLALPGSVRV